jgi:excisionase family DNA binding protein
MTVAEAARRLGVALTYVYSLLWAGKLDDRKISRQWRISATSVEARLKQRGE